MISVKLQKIAEGVEGVKSVSSLAGYEILTEGTGSNAGTCLINLKDWNDRKQSVVEIISEKKNLKVYQVQILNFSNRQRYLVMELPEDLNFVY
jgi:multidrug efflux pump subunit AcrB